MSKGIKLNLGKTFYGRVDNGIVDNVLCIGKDSSNVMWYEKKLAEYKMKAKDFYNVAVYLCLSRDDVSDGSSAESNSIGSQRDMIRSYIRGQDDMEIYDIYVDDGWSGGQILTGLLFSG